MNPSDESEDRELMERYRRASSAEVPGPRDAVRTAILEEGRRAAVSLAAERNRQRQSRWKMTAFATAATVLLAALVIAPKLLQHEGQGAAPAPVAGSGPAVVREVQPEVSDASTPPVPAAPIQPPYPQSKAMGVRPVPNPLAPREVPAPPPIDHPERRAENDMQNLSRNLAQSRSAAAPASVDGFAPRIQGASGALLAATSAGDLTKATLLLNQGTASVDERDYAGRTSLMLAVEQGRLDMVQLLLGRGADPNAVDQIGITPLKLAREKGLTDIATALTQAGAR